MSKYIIKRLLISIMILFFVTLIIYSIMRCIPTSYVEKIARERASLPGGKSYSEWLTQLNAAYGFDKGIVEGYFSNWLASTLKGDFGDSWFFNVPVVQKFNAVIWNSFILGVLSFVLEIVIAVPLGILAARKQYSRTDYAVTIFALIGISLPTFYFATILKYILSVKLGWLDLFGQVGRYYEQLDSWGKALDVAKHYIMPVITLTIVSVGGLMRYTRTNMLEVLNADYIRTARAKGLSEKTVIYKHAFRNTLIPLATLLAGILPGLFGGMMITEQVFAIDGIGRLAYNALKEGDVPFVMGYNMFLAILTVIGTLLSDIMYSIVDPRVKLGR